MMVTTVEAFDIFDKLLAKYELWETLIITGWTFKILRNYRRLKLSDLQTSSEIEQRSFESKENSNKHEYQRSLGAMKMDRVIGE